MLSSSKHTVSILLIFTLLASCQGAPGVPSEPPGLIAFNSTREGHSEVYTMRVDGSGQARLSVAAGAENVFASWSPDGTRIAFVSKLDEAAHVYLTNVDGSRQLNLTRAYRTGDIDEMYDTDPAWSPDGTKIALASNNGVELEAGGILSLYLINADGSGAREILKGHPKYNGSPAWSPDGTRIAFVSDRDSNLEIYLMETGGSGQTNLSRAPGPDGTPAWSPDGSKIVFVSERSGHAQIHVMNADGSGIVNVQHSPAPGQSPAWSPDGKKIVFTGIENGRADIFVVNADGSEQVNLTNSRTADDITPRWSPDGAQIAFASNRDGNLEIYSMNVDGSQPTNLTNNPAEDINPAWQP